MSFIRDTLMHNAGLKLLALALSFLLWATYTAEPVAEVGYIVPLEFNNIPADLEISGDVPTHVHVRIRGRPAFLRRLTFADLAITVDLGGRRAGEALVPLTPRLVAAPYGATVVRIAPEQNRVRLVPRPASP